MSLGSSRRRQLNQALIAARVASEASWRRPDDVGEPPTEGLRRVLAYLADPALLGQPPTKAILVEAGNRLSGGATALRSHPQAPLSSAHSPLPPGAIEGALQRFFEWVGSPSFGELHPAGQMAVAQARLVEIYPFETHGLLLASVFSSIFPMAAGLLLPVPTQHDWADWANSLELALQFSTEALTAWNLRACLQAYDLVEQMS